MLCTYCGKNGTLRGSASPMGPSRICSRCARLKKLRFVLKQGDGVTGFREIMIAQHANEPNRMLLETRSWHFTIFINKRWTICGFELADASEAHLLKWRRGKSPVFYRVENLGKGYGNHDVLHLSGEFRSDDVLSELTKAGSNIRPEVREVLLEGIAAYAKTG